MIVGVVATSILGSLQLYGNSSLHEHLTKFEDKLSNMVDKVDLKVEKVDTKIEKVDAKVEKVDVKVEGLSNTVITRRDIVRLSQDLGTQSPCLRSMQGILSQYKK